MNTLTIVAIGVIGIFALIGYAKGFVKMLLSVLSLVLTLYLASLISPGISEKLQESSMYDTVYNTTYEYINEKIIPVASESAESVMEELQLPDSLKKYIMSDEKINMTGEGVAKSIAAKLTGIIFDVMVFFITFIVAMIAVKIIFAAINVVTYLPIIHGANQLIGLLAGAAEGIIIVWIFFIVLGMMGNSEFAVDMYKQINESSVLTFLYENNFIMSFLFKV